MNKLKKLLVSAAACTMLVSAFSLNASAATVGDGVGAEISVNSQTDTSAELSAKVKNSNDFDVNGIKYSVSVSDNAKLSGDTQKSDVSLSSGGEDSISFKVEVEKGTQPATNATKATSAENAKKPAGSATDATSSTTAANKKNITTVTKTKDTATVQTGDSSMTVWIAGLGCLAMAGLVAYSIKKRDKRMLSLVICGAMTLSVGAVAFTPITANAAINAKNVNVTDTYRLNLGGEDVVVTLTVEFPEQKGITDNSLEDMKALNNGEVPEAVFKNGGRLSFLSGRYTDFKVTNWETALSSTAALYTLIGVDSNDITADFISARTDDNGDTYYTFDQYYENVLVEESTFIVGADKDGNVISFTSSIDPSLGVGTPDKQFISPKEVKESITEEYDMDDVKIQIVTEPEFVIFHDKYCYRVYIQVDGEETFRAKYVNAASGEEVDEVERLAVPTPEAPGKDNDNYFNVSTENMTFKDYEGNSVELPVAKQTDKYGDIYYTIIDTQRRIMATEYKSLMGMFMDTSEPFKFETADEVDPIYVSVFRNMQVTYDFFKDNYGLDSIDGNGMALRLAFGFTEDGEETDNAAFTGYSNEFASFVFSKTAGSVPLDTATHEYVHGIKTLLSGVAEYSNITGALEESYADIIGKLSQMIMEPETKGNDTWDMGEPYVPVRSMGEPHRYMQPAYVGDTYYMMSDKDDSESIDNGGVHINSGVLNNIAYKINANAQVDMKSELDVWYDTLYVFDPTAGYDDIRAYFKHAMRRNGLSAKLGEVDALFEQANTASAESFSWVDAPIPEGALKVTFNMTDRASGDLEWTGIVQKKDNESIFTYANMISSKRAVSVVEDNINSFDFKITATLDYFYSASVDVSELESEMEITGNELKITFSAKKLSDYLKANAKTPL